MVELQFYRKQISIKKLDLVIVQKPSTIKFIWLFIKLLVKGPHIYDPHFHYFEADSLGIKINKKEFAQVDGEEFPQKNMTSTLNRIILI